MTLGSKTMTVKAQLQRACCLLLLSPALGLGCAGPSRAQMQERQDEARRLMRARAVYMPPKGIDPCVGVTVRLTEENEGAERERALLAGRLSEEIVSAELEKVGLDVCRRGYVEGVQAGGLAPEPLTLKLGYAVDPEGRVCAVVERKRMEPIDPGATSLIETAANCAKDALFRAQFPAGLVEDQERIVKNLHVTADPAETISTPVTRTSTAT